MNHNFSIPKSALDAGRAAYQALIDDDTAVEAALAAWEALPEPEKVKGVLSATMKAHPAISSRPFWTALVSTPFARSVATSDAAIVSKTPLKDTEIPRLGNYRKILAGIANLVAHRDTAFVTAFLQDVCFQSCLSTNGRLNRSTGLFDRYGVRSEKAWCNPSHCQQEMPARSFRRLKKQLEDLGFIKAEQHDFRGKKAVWIKATDKLNRCMFEAGFWDEVRPKKVKPSTIPVTPIPVTPAAKHKPRGLSARHAAVTAECASLYKDAIGGAFNERSKPERWKIFEHLTQSIRLSDTVEKIAFAPPGSYRFKRLHDRLGLSV